MCSKTEKIHLSLEVEVQGKNGWRIIRPKAMSGETFERYPMKSVSLQLFDMEVEMEMGRWGEGEEKRVGRMCF